MLSGCSAVGSAPALGAGCREFESRHSDQKSRKSICSLGFYLLNARLERSNRNMPVAYCCHQCKHWWLPLSAPFGADANESRHSDQKPSFSSRKRWLFFVYSRSILEFRMLIFSFFRRNRYAQKDTTLSKALPMPNSKAIPVRVGVQTFVT